MAKSLVKSASTVTGMTFISRVMGFVRDMVVAHIFGATGYTDAFYVAFKIPNFMRRLFAEGAFSQAFIPILADYKTARSQKELKAFVDRISGTLAMILFIVTAIGMIATPIVIMIFAPGFPLSGEKYELASYMLRITFPYLLFISLTALAGGILNVHHRFAVPAFTPVLLNICMITAAIFFAPYFHYPIEALAWGVFAGGATQLLFQVPFLHRLELLPRLKWAWRDDGVQKVLKLMIPAIFGVSVAQISSLIDTMFASFLPTGSITWLYNSERLMLFPLGVFGVALATVVLPHLSNRFANQSHDAYSNTIDWAIRSVLIIGLPATIGLVMLSGPMLVTFFNYGKFTQYDVLMSQRSLVAYAIGVTFMMLVKILASGFYARQNVKTPVKIAVIALVANMLLNFAFIVPLQHAGLALASSLGAVINSSLLLYCLIKQGIYSAKAGWLKFFIRLTTASIAMVIFLFYFSPPMSHWFSWNWHYRVPFLFGLVCAGVVVYMAMLYIMGFRLHEFKTKDL